ncbi:MAG: hypothetical protein HFACDABA_00164 [Anaerolineales bacterium]|nr:hypothetical protein [Anaerolineales bacterium]
MAEQCEMIIGYLVPHRCEHPALAKCDKCGRGFCEEHLVDSLQPGLGKICIADQQGLDQPIALPLTAATFSQADIDTFHRASTFDSDDVSGDMFSDLS